MSRTKTFVLLLDHLGRDSHHEVGVVVAVVSSARLHLQTADHGQHWARFPTSCLVALHALLHRLSLSPID